MSLLSGATTRRRTTTLRVCGAVLGAALIRRCLDGRLERRHRCDEHPTTNISTGGRSTSCLVSARPRASASSRGTSPRTSRSRSRSRRLILWWILTSPTPSRRSTPRRLRTPPPTRAQPTRNTRGIEGIEAQSGYINAHATISALEPNTSYTYRVGAADGSAWSLAYTFTTKSFSGDFDFLFFGDPQVGSSALPTTTVPAGRTPCSTRR